MNKIGKYDIIAREDFGRISFALGYCEKQPEPYATWQGRDGDFFWGHYHKDKDRATADYYKRLSHYYSEKAEILDKGKNDAER